MEDHTYYIVSEDQNKKRTVFNPVSTEEEQDETIKKFQKSDKKWKKENRYIKLRRMEENEE